MIQAEVRRLARALAPYRVLREKALPADFQAGPAPAIVAAGETCDADGNC